jgi:hypothetical protein
MKDETTESLRRAILANPGVRETERAEAGLTTLSFASESLPNRNVWIDTDLGGRTVIDLEDFNDESAWDNVVARLAPRSPDEATLASVAWLSGAAVDDCAKIAPPKARSK